MANYITNFLEAMGMIAQDAVDSASFDRTIRAVITGPKEDTAGTYYISLSGGSDEALTTAVGAEGYVPNTVVFVTQTEDGGYYILGTDWTKSEQKPKQDDISYINNGDSIIGAEGTGKLNQEQLKRLKESHAIEIKADFFTSFNSDFFKTDNWEETNFGISLSIDELSWTLDVNKMSGFPYALGSQDTPITQSWIFPLKEEDIQKITDGNYKVDFFTTDLPSGISHTINITNLAITPYLDRSKVKIVKSIVIEYTQVNSAYTIVLERNESDPYTKILHTDSRLSWYSEAPNQILGNNTWQRTTTIYEDDSKEYTLANIQGAQGLKGEKGEKGDPGEAGTFSYQIALTSDSDSVYVDTDGEVLIINPDTDKKHQKIETSAMVYEGNTKLGEDDCRLDCIPPSDDFVLKTHYDWEYNSTDKLWKLTIKQWPTGHNLLLSPYRFKFKFYKKTETDYESAPVIEKSFIVRGDPDGVKVPGGCRYPLGKYEN